MPLPKQVIPVPFAQGADTKSDSFILPPGKLTVLQNGYLTKTGTVRKRPGHISLGNSVTDGTTLTSGRGIAAYRNELVVMDAARLLSYSTAQAAFKSKGALYSCNVSTASVVRATGNYINADQATNTATGLQMVTFQDTASGIAKYSIVDTASGQVLVDRQQIAANANFAKPVACGNYLVVIYSEAAGQLKFIPFSGTTAGTTVNVSGASFQNAAGYFDAAILPGLNGGDSTLCIAWNSTDVGGGLRCQGYSGTTLAAVGSTLTLETGVAADGGLAVIPDTAGSTQRFIFAYAHTTAVRVVSCNGNMTLGGGISDQLVVTLGSNCSIVVGQSFNTTTSSGRIYFTSQAAADKSTDFTAWASWSGNTFTSRGNYVLGWGISGKPFVQDGVMHLPTYFDPDKTSYIGQQPTYVVVNDGQQVARLFAGIGGGRACVIAAESQSTTPGQWILPMTYRDLLTTVPASPNLNAPTAAGSLPSYTYSTKGIACVTLNFFDVQACYSSAELADSLYVSGGQLMQYDGNSVVEHGFNVYPEGITLAFSGAGKNLAAGTYVYYAVYEWVDQQGRIHQSCPSPGVQGTATAGQQCVITLPTYRLGAKAGSINIVVYRTIANNLVPYRLGTVANSAGANTVTFTDDTVTDANITSAPPIYVLGNVSSNLPLGPCRSLVLYKNRIAGIMAEDPLSVAYSKQVLPGAPLEFNPDEFYIRVDPIGGQLTALGVMDDKLILFKESRILFSAGDGPDPTGQSGAFADPAIITTDCGCTDPRSVVTTPDGLMFRGKKGIYQIDRGLRVTYLGAPVENILGSYRVVSAVLSATKQHVRFGLSDNRTNLVYDYLYGQWSWYTNPELASVGACVYSGAYTYVQSTGVVGQGSDTVFTDFGNFVPLVVETGWFNLAQLNGYSRLYTIDLLARYMSSHTLRLSVAYDNADSYVQSGDVLATSVFGGTTYGGGSGTWGSSPPTAWGGPSQTMTVRFDPAQQKCSSFKLRIEDLAVDTSYGESIQLTGLSLLVGAKAGLRKLPATSQVGLS